MRHPLVFSRQLSPALLVVLATVGCSHPTPTLPSSGTGGGNAVGTGGTGVTGSGGGTAAGTGGTGEVIIGGTGGAATTDGGTDVPVTGSGTGGGAPSGTGGAAVVKMSCAASTFVAPFSPGYNSAQHAPFLAQATTKRQTLTPSEAADQMRAVPRGAGTNFSDIFRQPDNTNKGIRGFQFRDGPRGVNLDAPITSGTGTMGAIHGKSTVFPAPIARGATWDVDLENRIGQAMGDEMVAAGQSLLLAPTVNILRHPLWGRAQETYGEDPYQLGRMGTAHVAGVQQYVPACVKHYAANNIELDRFNLNAQMDAQTLREIYARHFEMIVRDGGVACVMAAYNSVNGTKSTQNSVLLTTLLRDEFKFNGFVITDWWAMPGASGGQNPTAAERNTNGPNAVRAGLDMELPWRLNYDTIETTLTPADIAPSVDRILAQKLRFKVDSTTGAIGLKPSTSTYSGGNIGNNDAHIAIAEEAASKAMVLLKNCPLANKACKVPEATSVLPIKRDGTIKSIAVVGAKLDYFAAGPAANPGPGINNRADDANNGTIDFPNGIRTGDVGSSRVNHDLTKSTTPFDGIKLAAGTGITVTVGNTVAAAQSADFVVVVAGLTPYDEGEEYNRSGDRTNFSLDGKDAGRSYGAIQNNLIAAVAALNKPMVVVLEGGSVIDMPWLASVPAVVMAWYPGMAGGKALGKLLMGDSNFSGKLPITWPTMLSQLPPFSMGTTTTMDYYLGYRYFDKNAATTGAPLFPYGYGLSYTTFEYSNLQVPCSDALKAGFDNDPPTSSVVNVTVDVANKGPMKGEEVVFLFVSYPGTTARRPVKELKGFYRVALDAAGTAGAAKRITIPLRVSDLKYYDMGTSSWQVASGQVKVMVGPSSANLPLSDTFTVK